MALPFFDEDSSTAVLVPTVKLQFGAAGDDSGFGGAVAAVASFLGGDADAWRTHLHSVQLQRGLAPCVDVLQVQLARSAHAPAVALGDTGSLELGYGDSNVPVFNGSVDAMYSSVRATTLTASNGGRLLAQHRINRSFENQTATDIIAALAQEVGVTAQLNGSGAALPRYVVDDARSLYEHMARLADLNGSLLYFDGAGVLQLIEAGSGSSVRTFNYGIDILGFQLAQRAQAIAGLDVVGEGAAGESGSNAAFWLRKDPAAMRVSTGTTAPLRYFRDARLRNRDAVSARAQALALKQQREATRSEIILTGTAELEPGAIITLAGLPESRCDGEYCIHSLAQRFDVTRGFVTELCIQRCGDASALGDLLGALGSLL
jgi:phage protein D